MLAVEELYNPSIIFIKISILLLYRRLFTAKDTNIRFNRCLWYVLQNSHPPFTDKTLTPIHQVPWPLRHRLQHRPSSRLHIPMHSHRSPMGPQHHQKEMHKLQRRPHLLLIHERHDRRPNPNTPLTTSMETAQVEKGVVYAYASILRRIVSPPDTSYKVNEFMLIPHQYMHHRNRARNPSSQRLIQRPFLVRRHRCRLVDCRAQFRYRKRLSTHLSATICTSSPLRMPPLWTVRTATEIHLV